MFLFIVSVLFRRIYLFFLVFLFPQIDPAKRSTALEAKNHPWLVDCSSHSGARGDRINDTNYDEKSDGKNNTTTDSGSKGSEKNSNQEWCRTDNSSLHNSDSSLELNQSEAKYERETDKNRFSGNKQSMKGEY